MSLDDKTEIERFILIMNIGFMGALREGLVTIEEIESYIYSPYSVEKLKRLGINGDIIDLVHLGCELEDVMSLIPDKLTNSISDIEERSKELLRSLPSPTLLVKKLID